MKLFLTSFEWQKAEPHISCSATNPHIAKKKPKNVKLNATKSHNSSTLRFFFCEIYSKTNSTYSTDNYFVCQTVNSCYMSTSEATRFNLIVFRVEFNFDIIVNTFCFAAFASFHFTFGKCKKQEHRQKEKHQANLRTEFGTEWKAKCADIFRARPITYHRLRSVQTMKIIISNNWQWKM